MKFLVLISFVGFSLSAYASLEQKNWSLKGGRKHIFFESTQTMENLEREVFSESLPFDQRWKKVSQVAENKSPEEALVFLKKCLKSKSWFLQSPALKFLKKHHPEQALVEARKLLFSSPALIVRSEAVEVIHDLGSPLDAEDLWRALNQRKNFRGRKSLWIRPQIARALVKLERSKPSSRWAELLSDSDPKVKFLAKQVRQNL